MTFDQYWDKLCEKTLGLGDPEKNMMIATTAFRKELLKAFKAGSVETKRLVGDVKDLADKFEKVTGAKSPSFEDLLNSLSQKFAK